MPNKKVNIQGTLLDAKLNKGIGGLLVKAFELDAPHRSLGEAFSNTDGNFVIEAEESAFDTLEREVYFQVYQGGRKWPGNTQIFARWNPELTEKDTPILITANPDNRLFAPTGKKYQVSGKLIDSNGKPVAGVKVKVYQKGVGQERLLGITTSVKTGEYQLAFYSTLLIGQKKEKPALRVKVYQEDTLLLASPLILNVSLQEIVNLQIGDEPYLGPTEYEVLHQQFSGSLEGSDLEDLTKDDVAILANESGVDSVIIAFYIKAQLLGQRTENTPANVWYALLRAGLPTSLFDLITQDTSSLHRALERSIKANIVKLDTPVSDIVKNIRYEQVRKTLKIEDEKQQPMMLRLANLAGLDANQKEKLLGATVENGHSWHSIWKKIRQDDTFTDTNIKELQLTLQLGAVTYNHVPLVKALMKDKVLPGNRNVEDVRDLAPLSVEQIKEVITKYQTGIPAGIKGETPEEQLENYASTVVQIIETLYPTQVILQKLEKESNGVPNKDLLKNFLKKNPDFDFKYSNIRRYALKNENAFAGFKKEEIKPLSDTLNLWKRLFDIGPKTGKYEAVTGLIGAGMTSAHDIKLKGGHSFVKKYAEWVGGKDKAGEIYRNASLKTALTLNTLAKFNRRFNQEVMPVLPENVIPLYSGNEEPPLEIADLKALFGSMDYCDCKHCRSVLSPAAYLVDLMYFLGQCSGTPLDELRLRRPDIENIQLSCKNTNTVLPYIDLVNEVLENAVAQRGFTLDIDDLQSDLPMDNSNSSSQVGNNLREKFAEAGYSLSDEAFVTMIPDFTGWRVTDKSWEFLLDRNNQKINVQVFPQTSLTTSELLANPEHINEQAYHKLATQVYPWKAPFYLWWEEARTYMDHIKLPLYQLQYACLPPNASNEISIACNYLGISNRELDMITDAYGQKELADYYGMASLEQLRNLEHESISVFLRQSKLEYAELQSLMKSRIVNPGSTTQIRFSENGCSLENGTFYSADNADIKDFFTQLYRFKRLQQKLGWTIDELDQALLVLKESGIIIGSGTNLIFQLAAIQQLKDKYGLPLAKMLSWWGNMATSSSAISAEPLYHQVFLNRKVLNPPLTEVFGLNKTVTELQVYPNATIREHLSAIAAILGLRESELDLLVSADRLFYFSPDESTIAQLEEGKLPTELEQIFRANNVLMVPAGRASVLIKDNTWTLATYHKNFRLSRVEQNGQMEVGHLGEVTDLLNLANLSHLYRIKTFCEVNDLSIAEYLSLKNLTGLDPFASRLPEGTLSFVSQLEKIRNSGLSIADWEYLLLHKYHDYEGIAPSLEGVGLFFNDLRSSIRAMAQENNMDTDQWTSPLHTALSIVLSSEILDEARAFIRGDFIKLVAAFELSEELKERLEEQLVQSKIQGKVTEDLARFLNEQIKDKEWFIQPGSRFIAKGTRLNQFFLIQLNSRSGEEQMVRLSKLVLDESTEEIQLQVVSKKDLNLWRNFVKVHFPEWMDKAKVENTLIDLTLVEFIADEENRAPFILEEVSNHLFIEIFNGLLTPKFALALSLDTNSTEQLLGRWLSSPGTAAPIFMTWLSKAFLAEQTTFTPKTFPQAFEAYTLLHKVAMVINRLRIEPEELPLLFQDHSTLGWQTTWADLNRLPVEFQTSSGPLFDTFERLVELFQFRDQLLPGEPAFITLMNMAFVPKTADMKVFLQGLSTRTTWRIEDLQELMKKERWDCSLKSFQTPSLLTGLTNCFRVVNQLGVSVKEIFSWSLNNLFAAPVSSLDLAKKQKTAQRIRQLVKAKYDDDRWEKIAPPLRNQLRTKQRDALLEHLIANNEFFEDSNDVYGDYLIDPEMDSCMRTSRIKQANASIQLFVQRILMNLEPTLKFDREDAEQWQWRKLYRVWEANRKVFLYPENWIEPELRDDKSPFFREFEDELMQGVITEETVEKAYKNYLDKLEEISRLEVCGFFIDDSKSVIHILARTFSSPHVYYYRQFHNAYNSWAAWEKVGLDIESDQLLPVVWNEKLFVFWPIFEKDASEKKQEFVSSETEAYDVKNKFELVLNRFNDIRDIIEDVWNNGCLEPKRKIIENNLINIKNDIELITKQDFYVKYLKALVEEKIRDENGIFDQLDELKVNIVLSSTIGLAEACTFIRNNLREKLPDIENDVKWVIGKIDQQQSNQESEVENSKKTPSECWTIQFAWSEHKNGKWTKKVVSKKKLHLSELDGPDLKCLNKSRYFFRVSTNLSSHDRLFIECYAANPLVENDLQRIGWFHLLSSDYSGVGAITEEDPSTFLLPQESFMENGKYVEHTDKGIRTGDFLNTSDGQTIFNKTPGQFKITIPHQYVKADFSFIEHPYFYQDDKRIFFFFFLPQTIAYAQMMGDQPDNEEITAPIMLLSEVNWNASTERKFIDQKGTAKNEGASSTKEYAFKILPIKGAAGHVEEKPSFSQKDTGRVIEGRKIPDEFSSFLGKGSEVVVSRPDYSSFSLDKRLEASSSILGGTPTIEMMNLILDGQGVDATLLDVKENFSILPFYYPFINEYRKAINLNGIEGFLNPAAIEKDKRHPLFRQNYSGEFFFETYYPANKTKTLVFNELYILSSPAEMYSSDLKIRMILDEVEEEFYERTFPFTHLLTESHFSIRIIPEIEIDFENNISIEVWIGSGTFEKMGSLTIDENEWSDGWHWNEEGDFKWSLRWDISPDTSENYPKEQISFEKKDPYSLYNWELFFHLPMLIASKLHQNQKFEQAQKWLHYTFNPMETFDEDIPLEDRKEAFYRKFWKIKPFFLEASKYYVRKQLEWYLRGASSDLTNQVELWLKDPFKPHVIARFRKVAYMKNVVMKYLDNLIAWGDQLFRRDTIESINEATQLYVLAAQILGAKPVQLEKEGLDMDKTFVRGFEDIVNSILSEWTDSTSMLLNQVVHPGGGAINPITGYSILDSLLFFCVPHNNQLLSYWDIVSDRLFKIRHCMSIEGVKRELPLFEPPIDPGLLVKAVAAGIDINSAINDISASLPYYRFQYVFQKSMELCNDVRTLGGVLLSVLEKKDAEELSLMKSRQEAMILEDIKTIKEKQLEEAKESKFALLESQEVVQLKIDHYKNQLSLESANPSSKELAVKAPPLSLLKPEINQINKLFDAYRKQNDALAMSHLAQIYKLYPDITIGTSGTVASPVLTASIGGTLFANLAQTAATGFQWDAENQSFKAKMAGISAEHLRMAQKLALELAVSIQELKQIKKQILGAEIKIAIAEQDLNNHETQIENAKEIEGFLIEKYTNKQLYNWMTSQLSGLYFQAYQMAYDLAKRAEKAFRHELGLEDADTNFIQFGYWDSLKKGLLAGEKLHNDLRRMEVAYLEKNKREYELTKHVSLALLHPEALLQLRETGSCYFDIPELLFDLDHPGQYLRRIKSVSLTIPCVTGPYTSVNAKLTLMGNRIRKKANNTDDYAYTGIEDDRFTHNVIGIQSIATSHAQGDSGLFELNFRDERYLPFEGAGAISSWRLELPTAFRQFDYNTISDVIIHLNYTAREGGDAFKDIVNSFIKDNINSWLERIGSEGEGLPRLFSLKEEFPRHWNDLVTGPDYEAKIKIDHRHFPYFLREKDITVNKVTLFFDPRKSGSDFDDNWIKGTTMEMEQNLSSEGDPTSAFENTDMKMLVFDLEKHNQTAKIYAHQMNNQTDHWLAIIDNDVATGDDDPIAGFTGEEVENVYMLIQYTV